MFSPQQPPGSANSTLAKEKAVQALRNAAAQRGAHMPPRTQPVNTLFAILFGGASPHAFHPMLRAPMPRSEDRDPAPLEIPCSAALYRKKMPAARRRPQREERMGQTAPGRFPSVGRQPPRAVHCAGPRTARAALDPLATPPPLRADAWQPDASLPVECAVAGILLQEPSCQRHRRGRGASVRCPRRAAMDHRLQSADLGRAFLSVMPRNPASATCAWLTGRQKQPAESRPSPPLRLNPKITIAF